jgi:dihydrofolate reductase
MRIIIYYVASSLDGYIVGLNEDISGFVSEGSGVNQYLKDLKRFDTVIMGKNTYEYGFQFGIEPGLPAYEHMHHYIFSESASYKNQHDQINIVPHDISIIKDLKAAKGSDIYLCGGGIFAGWLLEHEMIDVLKIKLSPAIFGAGIKLFENSNKKVQMALIDQQSHDYGMLILTYKIQY